MHSDLTQLAKEHILKDKNGKLKFNELNNKTELKQEASLHFLRNQKGHRWKITKLSRKVREGHRQRFVHNSRRA